MHWADDVGSKKKTSIHVYAMHTIDAMSDRILYVNTHLHHLCVLNNLSLLCRHVFLLGIDPVKNFLNPIANNA